MSVHRRFPAPRRALPATACAAVLLATVAGCGQAGPPGASGTPDTAGAGVAATSPSPSQASAQPTPTGHAQLPSDGVVSRSRTVEGDVVAGVERGCLLLDVGTAVYSLLGAPAAQLSAGDHVRISGQPARGADTTCMQGTPFEVTAVSTP